MKLSGEKLIPETREKVWEALNDLEVLKHSIPGCHDITEESEGVYALIISIAVGPVKAKFRGKLHLLNLNVPESYTLQFEGSGAAVGFGKGQADVHLEEQGEETVLHYAAEAQVGGKIAQVGARLINGVAKRMADEFFDNFEEYLNPAVVDEGAELEGKKTDASNKTSQSSRWKFWQRDKKDQSDDSETTMITERD